MSFWRGAKHMAAFRAARIARATRAAEKRAAKLRQPKRTVIEQYYGLEAGEIERRLDAQGGRCAICTRSLDDQRVCVDHDHQSQRVRGLLCSRCNTGLGQFKDDAELLKRAVEYVTTKSATAA